MTSRSEMSTPPELSMASVLMWPPRRAYSMRARWVKARLAPSPTTRARTCDPVTRTSALARSSISRSGSSVARTNVPTPPAKSRVTGAWRMARISSGGDSDVDAGVQPQHGPDLGAHRDALVEP